MKRRQAPSFQLPSRRRWNATDAQRVLAAIKASGQTVADFARKHGLRAGRIEVWRRRLGAEGPSESATFQEVARATVSAALEGSSRSPVDLVFPSGRVLRFDAGLPVERLGAIARALAEVDPC